MNTAAAIVDVRAVNTAPVRIGIIDTLERGYHWKSCIECFRENTFNIIREIYSGRLVRDCMAPIK